MKILANRHVGIIVHNFDKMLDFYIGLGFDLRRRDLEEGLFVQKLLNADSIILETAKLVIPDENIPLHYRFNLELMKIANAELNSEDNLINVDGFDFKKRNIGLLDLAFTVDDIQLMINYITDNGGDLISEPMQSISGFPALHSYARDPEGNVLHLAQNLREE
jgi:catechol 2,3-dioxygenase-like lactoylglutathione lyase family enzyme